MHKLITAIILFFIFAVHSHAQVIQINELQASNAHTIMSNDHYEFGDWLELINNSNIAVDLTGYSISDNKKNDSFWKIPNGTIIKANDYLLIWADKKKEGLHSDFALSSTGEELILKNKQGKIIDSISFPIVKTDFSYGRDKNGKWTYYSRPTPGRENIPSGHKSIILSSIPEFSIKGGLYSSKISLSLKGYPNSKIYYSTNGSIPTVSSKYLYKGAISITKNTIIRSFCIESGKSPSPVITQSYIFNSVAKLPIVSLTTNPDNLWNDTTGIYTVGTNGILGPDNVVANWQHRWNRPMNLEYYVEGEQVINQQGEMAIAGFIRNMKNKSIKIDAKGKYGKGTFDYKFFDSKNINSFKSLVLRNGGYPEHKMAMIRDGVIQESIINHTDIDYQGHQACVLYINGIYWGLYKIRERQNKEYLASNFELKNKNKVDMGEYAYSHIGLQGSIKEYIKLMNYLEKDDLQDPEDYDYIDSQINISQFLDYHIANIYVANTDWPGNNVKFWRSEADDIKWRWMMFDVDYGLAGHSPSNHNSLKTATAKEGNEWFNNPPSTIFLREILKCPRIRNEFIQRFASHMNIIFEPKRIHQIINKHYDLVADEMPRHIERWKDCDKDDPKYTSGCPVKDLGEWKWHVYNMRKFTDERKPHMQKFIQEYFNLSSLSKVTLETNDNDGGTIVLNGIETPLNETLHFEYFNNIPINIEAKAKPGYVFAGWSSLPQLTSNQISIITSKDTTIRPIFEPVKASVLKGTLKNITLKKSESPYIGVGEIIIPKGVTINSEPGVKLLMTKKSSFIIEGKVKFIGTLEEPIEFTPDYASNTLSWGAIVVKNNKVDTSIFNYITIKGASHGPDALNHKSAISVFEGNIKVNHANITENYGDPIFAQYAHVELRNSKIHSDITGDFINVKHGFAIVDNCEFTGNDKIDTDAIDYDDIFKGIISNNKVSGLTGFNSDAIDLGEGSDSIFVFNNVITNCTDKGVSIGQGSLGLIENNIITHCDQAIGIKDRGSEAVIKNNTFYNNKIGVAVFEKNLGKGGGKASITNTIFYKNESNIFIDDLSNIDITNSISETEKFPGENNLKTDPKLKSPELFNFKLKKGSPALNKKTKKTEIGADLSFNNNTESNGSIYDLKINEVCVKNKSLICDESGKYYDWIELYNPTNNYIKLNNLSLSNNKKLDKHIIKSSTPIVIAPKGYHFFWASNSTTPSSNHLNFSLKSKGTTVYLSFKNKVIDELKIPETNTNDQSYGRNGDGNKELTLFKVPTPSYTNNDFTLQFLSQPKTLAIPGYTYSYKLNLSSKDVEEIQIINKPEWLFIRKNKNNYTLECLPKSNHIGHYTIEIIAKDKSNKTVRQSYRLCVTNAPLTDFIKTSTEIDYIPIICIIFSLTLPLYYSFKDELKIS